MPELNFEIRLLALQLYKEMEIIEINMVQDFCEWMIGSMRITIEKTLQRQSIQNSQAKPALKY